MSHCSGLPPSPVAVVVSRSNSDRFSSLLPPPSPSAHNFPVSLLRSPSAVHHSQAPPNVAISPSPLPSHVLSSHIPSPLTPHRTPNSPRMSTASSHSLTSNSIMPMFGVFTQSQSSVPRGSHPVAPSTGSRTRWTPGVHNRIVHNISSLQHLVVSTSEQEEALQIPAQDTTANSGSEQRNDPVSGTSTVSTSSTPLSSSSSSTSSQPPRGPFRLFVRAERNRGSSVLCRRPFRSMRHYR